MTIILLAAIVTNLGIMPPTNLTHRAFPAHAAPTNQTVVTLGWQNSIPGNPGYVSMPQTSIWDYVTGAVHHLVITNGGTNLQHIDVTNGIWLSNTFPRMTNLNYSPIPSFTNIIPNYVWGTNWLDANAASNDMRTGIYGSTNLRTWYLRTNMAFAVSNRATLKMLPSETLKAYHGPRAQ